MPRTRPPYPKEFRREAIELDLERLQRISEKLAARIPDALLARLAGGAHLPHLEPDPATMDQISDFIDRLDG